MHAMPCCAGQVRIELQLGILFTSQLFGIGVAFVRSRRRQMNRIPFRAALADCALLRPRQLAPNDDIDGQISHDSYLVQQHMPIDLEMNRDESNEIHACIFSLNYSRWSRST